MLSLKEFKQYEVREDVQLMDIVGGISCEMFWEVMEYLDRENPEQAQAIRDHYEPSGWVGFQCY